MNSKRIVTVSKFLSKYLRHAPEELGLTLEEGGWVPIIDLLSASASKGFPITEEELLVVVETSDKKRFAINETGERIRANQGHSVEVDLQLHPQEPPELLYHGTTDRLHDVIFQDGLKKMQRHHVHLSLDTATARKVGARHGRPIVLCIAARQMYADGHTFFVSQNGVWLTDHVPPNYLTLLTEESR
jgi:putative RNA 2'-phosphotransferase